MITRRWFMAAVPAIGVIHRNVTPEQSVRAVKAAISDGTTIGKIDRQSVTFHVDGKAIARAVNEAIDRGHGREVLKALRDRT